MKKLTERLRRFGVPAFYWWATYAVRFLLWTITRWKVTGREHVPSTGELIIVSNHLSNVDPPVLASGIASRRIRFLAKIELFKLPFGIVVRPYGAIPVRRFDADAGAVMAMMRILRDGEVLGMFPEGTRSRTHTLGELHPGTAAIALRTGTPILPCAITGSENLKSIPSLLRRPRVSVSIGAPIYIEQKRRPTPDDIRELTDRMRDAISIQLPVRYRGTYTGSEGEGE